MLWRLSSITRGNKPVPDSTDNDPDCMYPPCFQKYRQYLKTFQWIKLSSQLLDFEHIALLFKDQLHNNSTVSWESDCWWHWKRNPVYARGLNYFMTGIRDKSGDNCQGMGTQCWPLICLGPTTLCSHWSQDLPQLVKWGQPKVLIKTISCLLITTNSGWFEN